MPRKHVDHSTDVPFTPNCTGCLNHDEIIHSHIPFLCMPFFSWDQGRKDISRPTVPKWIHYLLDKFYSESWILGWSEQSLRNLGRRSPEQHVVGTYVGAIVWIVRNSANRTLINEVSDLQKTRLLFHGRWYLVTNCFFERDASVHPFWCGVPGVLNCHDIPFSPEYSRSFSLSQPASIISRS